MHHKRLTMLIVAAVALISSCQECLFPNHGDLENVIEAIIATGENPAAPTVTVLGFNEVCLAFGVERDRYRGVSVVVRYTCTGTAKCPQDTAEEQIESGCVNGAWSNIVEGSTDNTRSENNEANFSTTTREDCSFCVSAELAPSYSLITDNITHCVACDSSCGEGLERCSGVGAADCCNFYHASMCVVECPSPFLPNQDNVCVCPAGDNCSEAVDCGTLSNPANGMVSVSTTTYNSVAMYSCNVGHTLTGDYLRTCLISGLWSDSEPTCTVVDCGTLSNPANGMVSVSTTTYNSVASYSCNVGHTLTGDYLRTCLISGLWSGSEPTCTVVDCGTLSNPANGMVYVSTTTYNSVASYSCNVGHTLTGIDMRTCLISDLWSGGEPTCTVVDCGTLSNPANGMVSVTTTTYNSVATYSCNTGHTLTGDAMPTCLETGSWSDDEQTCSACTVRNCNVCDVDIKICETCAQDYKLSDNECKCPVSECSVCDTDVNGCDMCSEEGAKFDKRIRECIVSSAVCFSSHSVQTGGPYECSSTSPLIAAIIVLAFLFVISLAGLGIALMALWMLYQRSSQSQKSTKQDFPMQENIAYSEVKRNIGFMN